MTTQVTNDDIEARFQSQLQRIGELERENTVLREVNDILRKAVAYYAPVCAPFFEQETGALHDWRNSSN